MNKLIKLCLLLVVLSIIVEAKKKKSKKNYCKKNVPKLEKCFEKGYQPAIFTDCKTEGKKMKAKKANKCAGMEAKVSEKCEQFQCGSSTESGGKAF